MSAVFSSLMNYNSNSMVICPTVTAYNPHEFREQMERIAHFAERIHIDFMDGLFTSRRSVELEKAWRPHSIQVDLHMMYNRPDLFFEQMMVLEPNLVIVQAEAEGKFVPLAEKLHEKDVKVGVALLQDTPVDVIKPGLHLVDHVMIFSGVLGHHGGKADLDLLNKVKELKKLKPDLEIGWDGGINDKNAQALISGGVDVLDVGGFIHESDDPKAAYGKLEQIVNPH